MRTRQKLAVAATTILLGVAAVAYAHPEGGMGPGAMGGTGYGMMGNEMGHRPMAGGMGRGMMGGERMSPERMSAHLADLKTALQLRPDQQAAWDTLSTAMTSQLAAMQEMHAQMSADPAKGSSAATLPERLEQRFSQMQGRMAQMASMRDTITTFYAQLSPEQKAVADRFMRMPPHGRQMASR